MTTSLIQQYYEALAEGRFLGNHCRACDRYSFPPPTACEQCGSFDVEPHQMSGKATLLFASHNLAPPPHPRFVDMAPYVYAHVLLEEGVVVQGVLDGVEATPDAVRAIFDQGQQPVELTVMHREDLPILAFRLSISAKAK